MRFSLFTLLLLLFTSCSSSDNLKSPIPTQIISGRDDGIPPYTRHPIYQAKIPSSWQIIYPQDDESLHNTIKPLCELIINDLDGQIKITIHNFPADTLQQRIPPEAQISRWKKQFSLLDPTTLHTNPQSFNGFSGFVFTASGILKDQSQTMLAWIMQIAPEHFQNLTDSHLPESKQMQSDFTIKAMGPPELMDRYQESIISFAKSFELIKEVPVTQ